MVRPSSPVAPVSATTLPCRRPPGPRGSGDPPRATTPRAYQNRPNSRYRLGLEWSCGGQRMSARAKADARALYHMVGMERSVRAAQTGGAPMKPRAGLILLMNSLAIIGDRRG